MEPGGDGVAVPTAASAATWSDGMSFRSPKKYKELLRQDEELAHVTVEINRCPLHEMKNAG